MARRLFAMTTALLAATLMPSNAHGMALSFVNKCSFQIELLHIAAGSPGNVTLIDVGTQLTKTNTTGANYIRHTTKLEATLVSITYDLRKGALYDISIVPPQAGYCSSFEDCRNATNGLRGFNVPVSVEPKQAAAGDLCRPLSCGADDPELCKDGFLFPTDSAKKHHRCAYNTDFDVTFCPDESIVIRSVVTDDLHLQNDTIQFPVSATAAASDVPVVSGLGFGFESTRDKTQAEVRAFDGNQPSVSPSMAPAPAKAELDFSGETKVSSVQAAVRSFETPQPRASPAVTPSRPSPTSDVTTMSFDTVESVAEGGLAKIPEIP